MPTLRVEYVPEDFFSGGRHITDESTERYLRSILNELIGEVNVSLLAIEVPYTFADAGGISSSTIIGDGARVLHVRSVVEQVFDNNAQLTALVNGPGGDEIIMAPLDSKQNKLGEYHRDDLHKITDVTTGPVKLTLSGGPTTGAGLLLVQFVVPLS